MKTIILGLVLLALSPYTFFYLWAWTDSVFISYYIALIIPVPAVISAISNHLSGEKQ